MNFLFDEDIRLENDFALLRPIDKADINNLLPVATKDKDLLQFSAAPGIGATRHLTAAALAGRR